MEYYDEASLAEIVKRSANVFDSEIKEEAALEIALRSRGTPRIANRLLKRVRDFSQVYEEGMISKEITQQALKVLRVDAKGLDHIDRKLLTAMIDLYDGGPVGLGAIAANISEDAETIEDMYEPYLLQIGFLKRTSRGRVVTPEGYAHLGRFLSFIVRKELEMNYTTKDFDFDLPEELIAQTPLKDRTSSRLLVVNKTTHSIEDKTFF